MVQGHTPRISPSGPAMGVARISISAPVAYVVGTPLAIPFDTVDYSRGFVGDLLNPPVNGLVFVCAAGLYQIIAQVQVSQTNTTITLTPACASGSDDDSVSVITSGATNELSVAMSALRVSTETPLSADVFAAIGCEFLATGGSNGNITSAEMLIVELGRQR